MPHVLHLVYVSNETRPLTQSDLDELLRVSRRNNAEAGITGALLYNHGSLIQVLEGEEAAVRATFGRIKNDDRHAGIKMVLCERKTRRHFPLWTMQFKAAPRVVRPVAPIERRSAASRAQKLLFAFESAFAYPIA